MNKTILSVIMALLIVSSALAQEQDAGVTPDNVMWGLDVAFDRLSLALTFGSEKKAEKALSVAEERLAEVKAMIEANKLEHSEKAQKVHEELLLKAQENIETLDDPDAVEQFQKELKLEQRIREHRQEIDDFLAKLEEQEVDREKYERVIGLLGEKVQKLEEKLVRKQERTRQELDEKLDEEQIEELEGPNWQLKAEHEQKQAEREIIKAEQRIAEFELLKERRFTEASDGDNDLWKAKEELIKAEYRIRDAELKGIKVDTAKQALEQAREKLGNDTNLEEVRRLAKEARMNLITGRITDDEEDETETPDNETEEMPDDETADEEEADDIVDDEIEDVEEDTDDEETAEEGTSDDDVIEEDLDDDLDEEVESEIEEELEQIEDEIEVEEPVDEFDDNILAKYGLTLPELVKGDIEAAKELIGKAKNQLQESRDLFAGEDFKAAYAHARFAKKLAGLAHTGKFIRFSEEERELYKELRTAVIGKPSVVQGNSIDVEDADEAVGEDS